MESTAVSQHTDRTDCERCGIEFGDGSAKCRRSKNPDLCLECAFELHGPTDGDLRACGATIDESPSYRAAMIDAGRGGLLR